MRKINPINRRCLGSSSALVMAMFALEMVIFGLEMVMFALEMGGQGCSPFHM